jgi:hypothetical protein
MSSIKMPTLKIQFTENHIFNVCKFYSLNHLLRGKDVWDNLMQDSFYSHSLLYLNPTLLKETSVTMWKISVAVLYEVKMKWIENVNIERNFHHNTASGEAEKRSRLELNKLWNSCRCHTTGFVRVCILRP